ISTSRFSHLCRSRPRGSVHSLLPSQLTLITRTTSCRASYLAALPSTRAIETRSLPTSLAATHRGFAFYVAFPKRSIPPIATCSMSLIPFAPLLHRDKRAKVEFLWDTAKAETMLRNEQNAEKRRSASLSRRKTKRRPRNSGKDRFQSSPRSKGPKNGLYQSLDVRDCSAMSVSLLLGLVYLISDSGLQKNLIRDPGTQERTDG